jgi:hypothetical protein
MNYFDVHVIETSSSKLQNLLLDDIFGAPRLACLGGVL